MSLDTAIKKLTDLRDSLPQSEDEIKSVIKKNIESHPEYSDSIAKEGYDKFVNDLYIEYSEFLTSKREDFSHQIECLKEMEKKYHPLLD
jgi:hypothetical protein